MPESLDALVGDALEGDGMLEEVEVSFEPLLDLVSCQEDCLNNEETSVDQDQDSFIPSPIPQDVIPPSQEPHSPPSPISCTSTKQDHDISSTIPKEIINDQEKNTFLFKRNFR